MEELSGGDGAARTRRAPCAVPICDHPACLLNQKEGSGDIPGLKAQVVIGVEAARGYIGHREGSRAQVAHFSDARLHPGDQVHHGLCDGGVVADVVSHDGPGNVAS